MEREENATNYAHSVAEFNGLSKNVENLLVTAFIAGCQSEESHRDSNADLSLLLDPRLVDGGVLVPALGIVITLYDLGHGVMNWHEARSLAAAEGLRMMTLRESQAIMYWKDRIDQLLSKACGDPLSPWSWTNTEYSGAFAWLVNFGSGSVYYKNKSHSGVVRPVAVWKANS